MAKWGSLILTITMLLNLVVVLGQDFNGFYFISQWLPSYCNEKGKTCCYPPTGKPPPDFTIYGLWPYNNAGVALQNCPGATFDTTPIKPLEETLRKNWPSFTCPQIGKKFWVHEWNKHGTCTKSSLAQVQYFKAAINLKNKMSIFQALAKAQITPNNQFYPLDSIKAAITKVTGFQPVIFCKQDAQWNQQLWQVLVCVDKSGTSIINCTNNTMGQCLSTTIKFPAY